MITLKRLLKLLSIEILMMLYTITNVQAQNASQELYTEYASNIMNHQSAASYNDYLILVKNKVSKILLYNLKTKKKLCSCLLEPKTEDKEGIEIFHANNCSFSNQKYTTEDIFPLLYISHRENNDLRGVLEVYRLIPMNMHNNKDFDTLVVKQIQTIYFPPMTNQNALGSPWTAIDTNTGYMYTYSRNNRKGSTNYGNCRISKFNIPTVEKESSSEVYLEDKDILDSYEANFNAGFTQGACIYNNKLYIAKGSPKREDISIQVVDLLQKKLVNTYNLKAAGFEEEPEGCFIYNNKLMVSTSKRNIYQINIPIEE